MSTAGRYAIISNQNEVTAAFAAFDNDKEAPMTWKEKRLITVLSIVLAVLFAAVLIVLSIRYRQARAETDGQTAMAETAQLAERTSPSHWIRRARGTGKMSRIFRWTIRSFG